MNVLFYNECTSSPNGRLNDKRKVKQNIHICEGQECELRFKLMFVSQHLFMMRPLVYLTYNLHNVHKTECVSLYLAIVIINRFGVNSIKTLSPNQIQFND